MAEEKSNNYISLQEATEYCSYTQEYLSLRARQGKLKAVKIGRNWITKKEWVKEYIERMKEYNNNLKEKKFAEPPENLPIAPTPIIETFKWRWKPFVMIGVGVVLLIAGITFGKESFKSVFNDLDPYVKEINQAGDIIAENTAKLLSETISDIPHSFINISGTIDNTFSIIAEKVLKPGQELAAISSPDVLKSTFNIFKEYGQWISQTFKSGYLAFNYFIEEKLDNAARIVLNGLKSLAQGIRKIPQAIRLFRKEIVTEEPEEEFAKKGEIEKLLRQAQDKFQKELEELKEKPEKVIEVSKITKIEPIKEIIKEIKTLDDESLKKILTTLSQQETEVGKLKLAASLGYVNLPPSVGPSGGISISTLGTITTGTWQAGSIEDSYVVDDLTIASTKAGSFSYSGTSPALTVSQSGAGTGALIDNLQMKTGTIATTAGDLTLDSDSGTVQLAAGNSLTVPGTITVQTTGSDLAGTVTVGTLSATTLTDGFLSINAGAITGGTTAAFSTSVTSPTIYGSSAVSGNLTLRTTSDATKGSYILSELTSDGFVKTSGGTGALSIDATSYQPAGTYLTSVTGTSPITSSGGTTPDIGLSQTSITNLNSALATGLLKITTGTGLLSTALAGTDYQAPGNYITALTGEVTATGPGSVAATITSQTSATWLGKVSDATGTGAWVFGTSPVFTTQITTPIIYGSSAPSGNLTLRTTSDTTKGYLILADDGGNVGIGTTGPDAILDVLHASLPQLRLTQSDGTVYTEFQVAVTTGDLTVTSVTGDDVIFPDHNLYICEDPGCPSINLSTDGNLIVETDIYQNEGLYTGNEIRYNSETTWQTWSTPYRKNIELSYGSTTTVNVSAGAIRLNGTWYSFSTSGTYGDAVDGVLTPTQTMGQVYAVCAEEVASALQINMYKMMENTPATDIYKWDEAGYYLSDHNTSGRCQPTNSNHTSILLGYFSIGKTYAASGTGTEVLRYSIVNNDNLNGKTLKPGIPLPNMVFVPNRNFAIDIYEAQACAQAGALSTSDRCSGTDWGDADGNSHSGNVAAQRSKYNVFPSRGNSAYADGLTYHDFIWAGEVIGKRLPTDAEWSRAAQYSLTRSLPTGTTTNMPKGNNASDYDGTDPEETGGTTANRDIYNTLGLCDLNGNLWEYVDDSLYWAAGTISAQFGSDNQYVSVVIRGGYWAYTTNAGVFARNATWAASGITSFGTRLAR